MTEEQRPVQFGLSVDEMWEIWLTEGEAGFFRVAPFIPRMMAKLEHRLFHAIPSDPRCVSCMAPFQGPGAPLMRALGRERSQYNPSMCEDCENVAKKWGARAEVPVTMLFADIRGSTTIAEEMNSMEFRNLVSRFYSTASNALVKTGAMIDKLIGDEVSAYWVPGIAGEDHPRHGFEGGLNILRETGHMDEKEPWIPVGVGVHTGMGVVGAVGHADGVSDITVLGDTANTAARLASEAKAGEIIFSDEIARRANIDTDSLEMRKLKLKGKRKSVKTWTFVSSQTRD